MRRLILALPAVLAGRPCVAAAAAAADNGLAPVTPESPNADAIKQTYWVILAVTGVIFVLVEGALDLLHRPLPQPRPRRARQEGAQIHGATKLETASTIVPVLILAGITAFVFVKLPTIKNVPAGEAPARRTCKIRVEGHQYYWQFDVPGRPGGGQAHGRARRPRRRADRRLAGRDPQLVGARARREDRRDPRPDEPHLVPGGEAGHYEVRCAELCGLEHAHMTGWVDVVTPAQYAAFLAARTAGNAPLGQEIFEGVCATVPRARRPGRLRSEDQGQRARRAIRRRSSDLLRNGKNKMPPVGATWDDATMEAATDYLKERFGGG